MKYSIGADIGGSHISCAAVNMDTAVLLKNTFSTEKVNSKAPAEEILERWANALKQCISALGKEDLSGIGFAMPGPFNYETGVAMFERVEKYESLHGLDVGSNLRDKLKLNEDIGFRFMNDATSFAVGEAWLGKAAGTRRSIALALGTGFGSAFIEDGVPVVERDDVPELGCLWHLPYKGGIADDTFSTRWFVKTYLERSGRKVHGAKEVHEAAENDPQARQVFIDYYSSLGEFLAPWVNKFKAEIIVMGGNISEVLGDYGSYFEESLTKMNAQIPIASSELKEDAAIIGSARLLDDQFYAQVKPLLSKM
ncbi:ROK family protein [Bacteroidota bacterium]